MVGSTKNSGSGHLLWPKWASSVDEVPFDLTSTIEYAQKILSWYENLPEKEIPPKWMWGLDWELETWFLEMKRIRESGNTLEGFSSSDEEVEMMDNEFAARFRDD